MRVFRVNLRCWISSFVLPLIRDLFVMVLSETLKRAVRGDCGCFGGSEGGGCFHFYDVAAHGCYFFDVGELGEDGVDAEGSAFV